MILSKYSCFHIHIQWLSFLSFKFSSLHLQINFYSVKWSESHSVMSDSLRPHGLYSPWNSLGQTTGMSSSCLLQRIFPTQGLNPGLPHCKWILYQESGFTLPQGKSKSAGVGRLSLLQRIFIPRNWTRFSHIAGRFFANWAIMLVH